MYVTALPSDFSPIERVPAGLRSHGRVLVEARALGERTVLGRLEEAGPSRARFPRSGKRGAALEAVLINTGGGIAGGDAVATQMIARAGAHLVATTQAAEKIYRSDGAVSKIDVDLLVEPGASLDWLPQWTILFDQARVERTISAEVREGARLLLVEPVALGRAARGERFATGALHDRWRIRRNGRLIYADGLDLGGDIAKLLDRPSIALGAAAFATVLLVAPDAEARLEAVRAALGLPDDLAPTLEAGASAWDGMLSVRLLARDSAVLDKALRRIIGELGIADPPRIWHS
ncbi:urease accessory protein UreD [Starkeya sp. ORNL1]|uniref:urease accessory protein UreD n=1 Tax=Starkeya sp. ORNL1 TaxID=2709380 RepID=UPI0014636A59|nr:urease accessory protein UreD [Starkeya sp. ORNL1]QJP13137.1 urease accessory protein UreD [Starkeya sp. ORNL1]